MKVIIHPPQKPEGLRELQKRVATVHAEAVLKYIIKLPCPKEQKIQLISSIQETLSNKYR